jgi:hypothetical protein
MIREGASQSLIKIEAVDTAIMPMGRKMRRRIIMGLTLSQVILLFKLFDGGGNLQKKPNLYQY